MKSVVMGIFDQVDDAHTVIAQLVDSPLDLDSVQVVHSNTRVQQDLCKTAGLPAGSTVVSALVLGALGGAAAGFLLATSSLSGGDPLLASLGPLLSAAAGMLLGGMAGVLAASFSERVNLPEGHTEDALKALDEGAAIVTVRTQNHPTAKAIGDLFRAGGSRLLKAPEIDAGQRFSGAPDEGQADTDDYSVYAPRKEGESSTATSERTTPNPDEPGLASSDVLFPSSPTAPSSADTPAATKQQEEPKAASSAKTTLFHRADPVISEDKSTLAVETRSAPEPLKWNEQASPFSGSAPDQARPESQAEDRSLKPSGVRPAEYEAASPVSDLVSLGLSQRVSSALSAEGIRSDSDLLEHISKNGETSLSKIKGIGPAAIREIKSVFGEKLSAAKASSSANDFPASVPKTKTAVRRPSPLLKEEQKAVDSAAQDLLRNLFGSDKK